MKFNQLANYSHINWVSNYCSRAMELANASSMPLCEFVKLSLDDGELRGKKRYLSNRSNVVIKGEEETKKRGVSLAFLQTVLF